MSHIVVNSPAQSHIMAALSPSQTHICVQHCSHDPARTSTGQPSLADNNAFRSATILRHSRTPRTNPPLPLPRHHPNRTRHQHNGTLHLTTRQPDIRIHNPRLAKAAMEDRYGILPAKRKRNTSLPHRHHPHRTWRLPPRALPILRASLDRVYAALNEPEGVVAGLHCRGGLFCRGISRLAGLSRRTSEQ